MATDKNSILAVKDVKRRGTTPIRQATRIFNVCNSTIHHHLRTLPPDTERVVENRGRFHAQYSNEDAVITRTIIEFTANDFPLSMNDMKDAIGLLC